MSNLLKYTGGLITKNADGTFLDEANRDVAGYYTSNTVDLHGHIIDKNAMLAALEDYRQWGTIREMHENPIGKMKSIGTPEWNHIVASVAKTARGNEVLSLVEEGIYKAFSVGLLVNEVDYVDFTSMSTEDLEGLPISMIEMLREFGYIAKVTGLTLIEVSIVDRPANPLARMQNVSKEIGASVNLFPSALQPNAIGVIENAMRGSGTKFYMGDSGIMKPEGSALIDITEKSASVENLEVIVENEVEVTEIVDDANEQPEVEVVEEVVEKAVEVNEIDTEVSSFLARFEKAIDSIEKTASDVAVLVEATKNPVIDVEAFANTVSEKMLVALKNVTEVEAQETVESTEEVVVEKAIEPNIDDALVKKFADVVRDEVSKQLSESRMERKGTVNNPTPVEEDKPVTLKALDTNELRKHIVGQIAGMQK